MKGTARPHFDRERLQYFRRELAGYATAISPQDPGRALKVLNPTIMDIAELCTGYTTVDEIKRHFAVRYGNDPTGMVSTQVDEALLLLELYNLVTVEQEQPGPSAGDGQPAVRRLEEWDLCTLRVFLSGGAFPEKEHPPVVHYRHPYVTLEAYTELLIRMRLFHQKEHYYVIERDGAIEFLLSVFDERPVKNAASVALIAGIEAVPLADGIARTFAEAERDLTGRVRKIQWRYVTDGTQGPTLTAAMEQAGLRLEASIPDEFGPGRAEEIWARILEPPAPVAPEEPPESPDSTEGGS
jgi:hypothetical protein